MSFCEQAPIARYMAVACKEQWSAGTARKFVRQYREGRIPPQMIIQLAHQAIHGKAMIGYGIDYGLNKFGKDNIGELKEDLLYVKDTVRSRLVTGHFGTLVDKDKQHEIRAWESSVLLKKISELKADAERANSANTAQVMHFSDVKSPQAWLWHEHDFPDRLEWCDQYTEPYLDEFARYAVLRHQAMLMPDDEIVDVWGVTGLDILAAVARQGQLVQEQCDVMEVPYSKVLEPLTVWKDHGWIF